MSKTNAYIHQSLAGSGIALLDSQLAYRMRPDLWATGQDCAFDCGTGFKPEKLLNIEGVTRMAAMIDGRRIVLLARSLDRLAERIHWITGLKVENVEPVTDTPRPAPAAPRNYDNQLTEAQRVEKLRKLAVQEPPAHDCALRKDILAAQAELERMGIAA